MNSTVPQFPELIKNLTAILEVHRPLFKQERTYLRSVMLLLAELFAFGRHTTTQLLMTLGRVREDWSAWYRLWSRDRFPEEAVAETLFQETLTHVAEEGLYVVGIDSTQVPRSSRKMEGTSWLKAPRTPPFFLGIHRAQRFLNGSWLTPLEQGYSRAIPLRFLPAFPEKAVRRLHKAVKEWAAGLQFAAWVRGQLDRSGRRSQAMLVLADGSFDTLGFWQGLPDRVIALVRSAKNRCLFYPLDAEGKRDKRRKYGPRASAPQDWLKKRKGWRGCTIPVRGKPRSRRYRVEGPFVRRGLPEIPLFLIVVCGQTWTRRKRRYRRDPVYYLVNAVQDRDGNWVLPLPIEILLTWAWHRWELEVCHRELKSNLGLGDKQSWHPLAAVRTVQWSAWAYAVFVLAGYRTWGLCNGPPVPTRWWKGSQRWSFNTLWRAYRAALWGEHQFRALYSPTPDNLGVFEDLDTALWNAVYGSVRI